jgi:hypothetical protein
MRLSISDIVFSVREGMINILDRPTEITFRRRPSRSNIGEVIKKGKRNAYRAGVTTWYSTVQQTHPSQYGTPYSITAYHSSLQYKQYRYRQARDRLEKFVALSTNGIGSSVHPSFMLWMLGGFSCHQPRPKIIVNTVFFSAGSPASHISRFGFF